MKLIISKSSLITFRGCTERRKKTYRRGNAERPRRPKAAVAVGEPAPRATKDDCQRRAEEVGRPSSCEDGTVAAVAGRKELSCWPKLQSRPGPCAAAGEVEQAIRASAFADEEDAQRRATTLVRSGRTPECRRKSPVAG